MKLKKSAKLPMMEDVMSIEPSEWQQRIRSEIQHVRKSHAKAMKENKHISRGILDLEPAMEKRRVSALLTSLEGLDDKKRKFASNWITLNIFSESYVPLQYDGHVLKAAAIWLLDKITELDIPQERLYELLPTDEKLVYDLFTLDFWDCQYEEELVASVEYVLYYRNQDIAPLESDGGDGERVLTSNLSAEGKDHADVPSRKAFETLLDLLPKWMKDDALKQFQECYQAWSERFFTGIAYFHEQYLQKLNEANSILKEVNRITDEINEKADRFNKAYKKASAAKRGTTKKPSINALLLDPMQTKTELSESLSLKPIFSGKLVSSAFNDSGYTPNELDIYINQLQELSTKHAKALTELDDVMDKRDRFLYAITHRGYFTSDYIQKTFPIELHKCLIKPLPITDPYEMCFALLYSIEIGSDIPWLYGSCIGMMSEVVDSLPWGLSDYSDMDDPYWEDVPPIVSKSPDFPDWYKRDYGWKGDDEYDMRNLAQIVYETTGCLMPRNMHRYDAELKNLGKFGIKQNKAIAILYCMLALGNSRRQMSAANFDPDLMKMFTNKDESDEESETTPPTDWKTQKATLEKQISQLKSALYNAEKSAEEAKKKLEQQKSVSEAEHRELADLREVVFNKEEFDSYDGSAEEVVDDDKYPYTVQKSTVVFGGHETWVKVLKPMLKGDIKFIVKEMKIDVSLVRYAEVIWIQCNAIPHRSYYSIVNTARKLGKPIRYFTNASAVKCADQIVENDKRK